MLNEHTLDQLRQLRLDGMIRAVEEQATSNAAATLSFDERFTLLVQRELAWRDDRRVVRLLKAAKLKVSSACVEDINWRASRSLDRSLIANLAGGDWLRNARNLLITGATGSGKTWLACALAHQAARGGFSVLYVRAARLFDELQVAHGDGSFARRLAQMAKLDLLVIDDFATRPWQTRSSTGSCTRATRSSSRAPARCATTVAPICHEPLWSRRPSSALDRA